MALIYVVEDDEPIRRELADILARAGFEVEACESFEHVSRDILAAAPDLVLLDLTLPVKDGQHICHEVRRESEVPIIVLTSRTTEIDEVMAMNLGADDYVTKPFDVKELIARVHAVMRRSDNDGPAEKKLTFDKLIINLDSYELVVNGVKVDTPPKEMELLYHLAASPNRVFTRNQLLDEVWGFDYFGDSRTVDVHIKRLREKLEGVSDKWCLKTVWGVGYKFEVTE